MIASETARDIALAYREIETAEKLLSDVRDAIDRYNPTDIRDAFGRRQMGLQLGVPTGQNGHRLFDVPYSLAIPIIETHIAHHKAQVSILCQRAVAEMEVA